MVQAYQERIADNPAGSPVAAGEVGHHPKIKDGSEAEVTIKPAEVHISGIDWPQCTAKRYFHFYSS